MAAADITTCDEELPLVCSQLRDLIECTICLEIYNDPVALPCQHSFCRQCLEDIWSRMSGQQIVLCPMCRRDFVVPKGGFIALEKDFKMNRLIGIYQSDQSSESRESSACPIHRTKALDVYCHDCTEVTCSSCFLARHGGHRGSDVGDSMDAVRKQLDQEVDMLSMCVVKSIDKQTRIRADMFRSLDDIQMVEDEILKTSEDLKEAIERHRRMLLEALNERREMVQKEMEEREMELDECVEATEKFKMTCCKLKAKSSELIKDICLDMKNIRLKAKELQQRHESQIKSMDFKMKISFKATKLEELLQNGNIVGKIESDEITDSKEEDSRALPVSPGQQNIAANGGIASEIDMNRIDNEETNHSVFTTTTFDVPETAWSVTVLENLICILCRSPTSIQFYRNHPPYNADDEVRTSIIANPWNMKTSSSPSCLYVTDKDKKCIWRVLPGDHTVTKWLAGVEDPYRVSVSKKGDVFIVKWGNQASVHIFRSDGSLIDRLQLPLQMMEPRDVIVTSVDNVIVSHRWKSSGLWGVSELTRKGQIVRRFDPVGDSQRLNFPSDMSLDSVDRVFVADFNRDRVILLDGELRWNRVLLTKQNDYLEKPKSLCYDQNKKQLLVAYNGKIKILCLNNLTD